MAQVSGTALDSNREIEITTLGRTTGQDHSHPVWFVHRGATIYMLPIGGSGSQWFKNIRKNPTMKLHLGPARTNAAATPITDHAGIDRVLGDFRAKYGEDEVSSYWPSTDVAVEVHQI